MEGFLQYLKDTRGELRHVAWPTQTQTIVYTVLVALLSVGVALYLGLFDFLFTTGLTRVISILPGDYQTQSGLEIQTVPTNSTETPTGAPVVPAVKGAIFQVVPESGTAPNNQ